MKEQLTQLIAGIISVGFMAVSLIILFRMKRIAKAGSETIGTVISFENSTNLSSHEYYPTVKFQTNKKDWITGTSNIGIIPGMYKKGRKVKVVYHTEFPQRFFIDDKISYWIPRVMIIVGVVIGLFSLWQSILA